MAHRQVRIFTQARHCLSFLPTIPHKRRRSFAMGTQGEISEDELVRAIDRLTFNHGDSRINGRPVVLKPVN